MGQGLSRELGIASLRTALLLQLKMLMECTTTDDCRCERITSPFSSVNAFHTFAEMSAAADEVVTKANKRAAAKK